MQSRTTTPRLSSDDLLSELIQLNFPTGTDFEFEKWKKVRDEGKVLFEFTSHLGGMRFLFQLGLFMHAEAVDARQWPIK